MTNHPENTGHKIITPYSEEVLKAANKIVRRDKFKYMLGRIGRGAFMLTASYGMTPEMYVELQEKDKKI